MSPDHHSLIVTNYSMLNATKRYKRSSQKHRGRQLKVTVDRSDQTAGTDRPLYLQPEGAAIAAFGSWLDHSLAT